MDTRNPSAEEHAARIRRLDAMIERSKHFPSIPEVAHGLHTLTQQIEALMQRVAALEDEAWEN
jgi:polyhydroxyalkanoate synthesis regulator phasin